MTSSWCWPRRTPATLIRTMRSRRRDSGCEPFGRAWPMGLQSVAAIAASDDVVDGALQLVVALARATVTGADGVSVSLRRRGQLSTVAASDQTISAMDAGQYATGEALHRRVGGGSLFDSAALDTEMRWPAFTPRALALGIKADLVVAPFGQRPTGRGAEFISSTAGAFATDAQQLASVFAAEASTILSYAGVGITDDQMGFRFGEALETRQVIALAQGVTMERDRIDEHAAYTALRRISVRTGRPLRERAEDVVASTQWAPDLSTRTDRDDD